MTETSYCKVLHLEAMISTDIGLGVPFPVT